VADASPTASPDTPADDTTRNDTPADDAPPDDALATLLDGRALAAAVREEVRDAVAAWTGQGHRAPFLAVVLANANPASASYVRGKEKAAGQAGIESTTHRLDPSTLTQARLLDVVRALNDDDGVDGVLVQLPLPDGIDTRAVLHAIDPAKDVDGFHPENVGRLVIGAPGFVPATPAGIMEMLRRAGVETEGARAVVVGRSTIVGKPMASLLLQRDASATVTVCHSRTRDLAAHTRAAEILVAAVGRPAMITADMVKPGATVIDVGINRVEDASRERGYRLVGDVDFEAVRRVAGRLTPVPGGVGPMTIAMLLKNTFRAARLHAGTA
jgi:methylenetetrahydrofolate dehydrogenase (NADP+)/methenyltetrahydrofolate cyclohydrolase